MTLNLTLILAAAVMVLIGGRGAAAVAAALRLRATATGRGGAFERVGRKTRARAHKRKLCGQRGVGLMPTSGETTIRRRKHAMRTLFSHFR